MLLLLGLGSASARAAPYSALVVDANTGRVLYSKNADSLRYPASLTKMMTLYVLFEFLKAHRVDMHTRFVVTPNAAAQAPSKLGLQPGDTIMVIDAIRALVTKSANDVAVVVAENLGGTEANFGRMMTATARRLGMSKTVYRNPSGLPNDEQVTTASDMVKLAQHLMHDFPEYYDFFSIKQFSYAGNRYKNHNKLLFNYEGTDGIKTGYTRASGFNLVASVRRNDKHLIGVVMGGKTGRQRDARMRSLLDHAFPTAVASSTNPDIPFPARNPIAAARDQAPTATIASNAPARPEPSAQFEEGDASPASYQVQVGAYVEQSDAERRLVDVQAAARPLLKGRQPITLAHGKGSKSLYRARFAGFTEEDARSACKQLKGLDIACIVMPAE
jgi:D-alanyl-D-alanine carboxypeptidase